jgi:hypothetical protein
MPNVTIELPDDLARRLELMAAARQRTVQQFAIEGLRSLLEAQCLNLPGSPAAIIRAARDAPQVSASDVDDLEAAICAGRLPIRENSVFTDPAHS